MRKILSAAALLLFLIIAASAQTPKLKYTVNLKDLDGDLFNVTLDISGLHSQNDLFQFASTAPGTYQVMDIGRFVRDFKAFDKKGNEIAVKRLSDNQFQFSNPKKIRKIVYRIAETWDTPVDKNVVYKMCGSSIENDNVLINGQCVFGYPKGMQSEPMEIKLAYPDTWDIGTALSKNKEGNYHADNYDQIVDSPILLGRLTKASTTLGKASVEIYTYSKTGLIKSEDLLKSMENMLRAADAFLGGLPVDRYTFLFHFEDQSAGAWEHSYSSEYVMTEQPYSEEYGKTIKGIAAHEFFHVVTPLNIHSDIIEPFNFVTPVPSEHLWLYEGTTEWASDIMQLRYGLLDLDGFLNEQTKKLGYSHHYDTTYSLSKLALTSYSEQGQRQYGNIYLRGAIVAGLLDIRLLELSNGKKGLREVIRELSKQYGPHRAFPEKEFFQIFTSMTYPEIADFFNHYVKNADPLPIASYYAKLGIRYTSEIKSGEAVSSIGAQFYASEGKIRITDLRDELKAFGLIEDDEVTAINAAPMNLSNAKQILKDLREQPIGSDYTIVVKRPEGEVKVKSKILVKEESRQFVFEVDPQATEKQVALRNAWMKNL